MKIIGYIVSGILILFGILFILGSGSNDGGGWGWVGTGVILTGIGFVIIWFLSRKKAETGEQNVSVHIDLPGEVNLETMTCKACGGTLTEKDIKLVAGAPMVVCPYCDTSYQITEEPKW